jgi:hypothetical protein
MAKKLDQARNNSKKSEHYLSELVFASDNCFPDKKRKPVIISRHYLLEAVLFLCEIFVFTFKTTYSTLLPVGMSDISSLVNLLVKITPKEEALTSSLLIFGSCCRH